MKVSSPCLSAFLVAALCPSLVVQAQFTLQILHTSDLEGGVDAFVSKWLVDGMVAPYHSLEPCGWVLLFWVCLV